MCPSRRAAPAEFHEHCLAETAGFSIPAMHVAKKHFDLDCSPWAQASESRQPGPADVLVTRNLRFTMLLDPMPFTPKQTCVEMVQRYAQYAGPVLAVESSTRRFVWGPRVFPRAHAALAGPCCSLNVPYGDYFTTEELWVVGGVDARYNIAQHEVASPADVAAACSQVRQRLGGALRDAPDDTVKGRCCRFLLATYVK